MMTHADAFLEAILAEPDDDAHRLVFADWLQEQGDEAAAARGAFIRVQCTLAALPAHDPRRRELEEREQALLAEHEDAWVGPLRSLVGRWRFRRGFVEEVTLSAADLLQHGADLFRLAPVRCLHLRGAWELPTLLETSEASHTFAGHLARITELDLSQNSLHGDAGLALLTLPRLPRLTALRLGNTGLMLPALRALADSPVLESVATLGLRGPIGTGLDGVLALLESPHLGRLTHLDVSAVRMGNQGVSQLLQCPRVRRLTTLRLGHNGITEAGVAALVRASATPCLTALDLSFNPLDVAGVSALGRAERPHLESLNLSRTGLGDAGAEALAGLPLLGQLLALDLSLNRIGDRGGRALAACARPARLATLDLIYNHFGADTRRALCRRFGEHVCLFQR